MRAVGGDTESSRAARTAAVLDVRTHTGLSLVGSSLAGGGARRSPGVSAVLASARLPFKKMMRSLLDGRGFGIVREFLQVFFSARINEASIITKFS